MHRVCVTATMENGEERNAYGEWSADQADVEQHAKDIAAHVRQETKGKDYMPEALEPGDIIQLDPTKHDWGALLCIVDAVKPWGVQCYWLQATTRGENPGACYYRAETGTFKRVGKAEWLMGKPEDG